MALTVTTNKLAVGGDGSIITVNYDNLDELDATPPSFEFPEWANQSVQIIGTFGAGNVSIEGSNDGATWAILLDPAGAAITFSAAGIKEIGTPARFIRPKQPTGTTVDVDLFFLLRRIK